jgi:2-dehydropantoate 2-reductase
MTITSIAIVGGGALGCYFAARLAEAGFAVTVIDVDRARLETIAAEGIVVDDSRGRRSVPVQAATADGVAGPVDLVMLFTKGVHSAAAARSVAHLARPGTLAVTLQNGLGNADVLADTFGPENVLIGMTDVPADLEGANAVASKGSSESALGGFLPECAAKADAVADVLRKAGFLVDTANDVHTRIWEKLAFNAAINAVSTITGRPNGGMNSEPGRRLLASAAAEAIAVAEALGIRVNGERVQAKLAGALSDHGEHRPSMLQDFTAGRRTEIESINGAVIRAGRAAGVPTPINATLADIIRLMEAD